LSGCSKFAALLATDWASHPNEMELGADFLRRAGDIYHGDVNLLPDPNGFRSELTGKAQGPFVGQHVYFHAGLTLRGGRLASLGLQFQDYIERWTQAGDGKTAEESDTEIADDRAAREVGDALHEAYERRRALEEEAKKNRTCPDLSGIQAQLQTELERILCGSGH
jgi:hypothetical protein